MKSLKRPLILAAMIAVAAPAAVVSAQEALTGRVAEVFGNQFLLDTGSERILVTPSRWANMPEVGSTISITGNREGSQLRAALLSETEAPAPAADDAGLPEELRGLSLRDIRDRKEDDGDRRIGAHLPDGAQLRVEYDSQRGLEEVETDRAGSLPSAMLDRILPAALRETDEFKGIARVTEIEFDRDEIQIEGFAADGAKIEIDASPEGRIHGYEQKRDRDQARAMQLDEARTRLTGLGYSVLDSGHREDDTTSFIATNPHGERVDVRLDDEGRVTREAAM